VQAVIQASLSEIAEFTKSPTFQAMLNEMWAIPPEKRPEFVLNVILSPAEREKRSIVTPQGMVIQRSAFADGRPTLFCVTKRLPPGAPWHKVTFTFDNPPNPSSPERDN
jgi:hypothetical protein